MGLSRRGSGWERLVRQVTSELAPDLPPATEPTLARLLDLVCDWNARVDLTAARSAEELVDLFIADAALLARTAKVLSPELGRRWVDVGSGAGAPAIPLALFVPELELTLVEPRSKRVAFLRTALGVVGRSDVKVQRGRSEELGPAGFDVALSRATLPPLEWLREGARVARSAVWVLLARGERPALDGWRVQADVEYRWPLTAVERRAICYVPDPG